MKAGRLGLSFPFDSEQKSAPSVLLDQGYNFPKRYETSLLGSQMSRVHHAHTGDVAERYDESWLRGRCPRYAEVGCPDMLT